jgi:hypothetical protein
MSNEIEINGEVYVKKNINKDDQCQMVRTYSAGVFAGYIKEINNEHRFVVLQNARRIWKWEGAASLSQLAMQGTSKPEECKFPCPVDEVVLYEIIEIIPMTEKAKKSIDSVKVWSA